MRMNAETMIRNADIKNAIDLLIMTKAPVDPDTICSVSGYGLPLVKRALASLHSQNVLILDDNEKIIGTRRFTDGKLV